MEVSTTPHRRLLHVFPTFGIGGVQNRIVRIINSSNRKFRHTIVSVDGNFEAASGLQSDIDVALEEVHMRKTSFLSATNFRLARDALRRLRPDLLLTYNWGTIEWALANRVSAICPHIHFESGFGPDESPQRQHWRRIRARRLLLSRSRYIVVPSMTLYEIATRVWKFPASQILYIPNGVDCSRFAEPPDAAACAAFALPEGAPVVGTVAALRREKNLMRLIRAFAALPRALNAWLVIVGDGAERSALEAAGAGKTDRIVFAGHMSEPSRILGRFDVFALSSDTEQMPNSVLEAMAGGLAVAATDVGDVKRMLSAANAPFVIPAEDESAFTEAIYRLLQDRELAGHVGRANRDQARTEFSFDAMVDRYESLYSEN